MLVLSESDLDSDSQRCMAAPESEQEQGCYLTQSLGSVFGGGGGEGVQRWYTCIGASWDQSINRTALHSKHETDTLIKATDCRIIKGTSFKEPFLVIS